MLISPSDLVATAKATIRECSVGDVLQCSQTSTVLIDIREPDEFHRAHIPGALHLPRGLLEFEIQNLLARTQVDENLAREKIPMVLYCGTGGRSALAALTLNAMGYTNVQSMSGGIVAWTAARLPVDYPQR